MVRKRRALSQGTRKRWRQVIEAALACFNETGFIDTTMEDIRDLSGASTGSIYHHFKSKEELAAAVYLEGIVEYQKGMVAAVKKHRLARAGIEAMVRYHLQWVTEHPDWARYLMQMRHAGFMKAYEQSMAHANTQFAEGLGSFFRPHVERGVLRTVPRELFIAIVLGPCQEYARLLLSMDLEISLRTAVREITEAAWQALRVKEQ